MTFDFPQNDLKMAAYVTAKGVEIGKAMGAKQVAGAPRTAPYTTTVYQTTHNTGGTVMGNDPRTSVVNRYLQSWTSRTCSSSEHRLIRRMRPGIRAVHWVR